LHVCRYQLETNSGFCWDMTGKVDRIGRKGRMMAESCEFLDKCAFFSNYHGNAEVIKQGWIRRYCEDQAKSAECERRKIRERTGVPPAANISPDGWLVR
jgi:hypothetical protein